MKITIEPTSLDDYHNSVSISNNYDDCSIEKVMELIELVLLAWGFSQETIDSYFKENEDEKNQTPL